MAEEITQKETELAGFPCSDSKGADAPDVAEVEVIDYGE